ncbi:MAG: hypothetical protein JSW27_05875 [Phycisphaerales bacterium]|nr:MAG: hypothetical protein JSW27_05875 [Phycisphaerales bacterium]
MNAARVDSLITGVAWSVMASVLLQLGCEGKPRTGMTVTSWKTTSAQRKVDGVDKGSAYFGRYRDGVAIIFWTDLLACKFQIEDTWDKARKCAKYAGRLKSPSGREINVECYVSARMQGTVRIDQQEYDLADGSLFLVSFRPSRTDVEQVSQDIYDALLLATRRKQLIKDIPEIKAFFERAANEEQFQSAISQKGPLVYGPEISCLGNLQSTDRRSGGAVAGLGQSTLLTLSPHS